MPSDAAIFEEPVAEGAEQERAVDRLGDPAQRPGRIGDGENLSAEGIDGDGHRRVPLHQREVARPIGGLGRHVGIKDAPRNRGERCIGLTRDGQRVAGHDDGRCLSEFVPDTRIDHHDGTGHGQYDEEGDDEDPGIEVPSPGGEIEFVGAARRRACLRLGGECGYHGFLFLYLRHR